MPVITTGAHPKELWPGVKTWFGQVYKELPKEYERMYEHETSDKAYEEDVESYSFGLAQMKEQGKSFVYDEHSQGPVTRYTHSVWGLGFIVTMEELEDNQYKAVAFKRTRMLAQSINQTKEINGAFPFNNGFSSSFQTGDGQNWFASTHPTMAGNQSNIANTNADFSEAALEDLLIQISLTQNNRGHITNTVGEMLAVHPNDQFNAIRVLGSPLTTQDAGNSINAVRQSNAVRKGHMINHFFSSTVAWFVQTDYPEGTKMYQRSPYRFEQDNDNDTLNAKAKAWERYSFGVSDFGVSSAGAGAGTATSVNSPRGLSNAVRVTASRRKKPARIQSTQTRTLRLKVGTRLTW